MKKGSKARLIQPEIKGKVVKVRYDEDADTKQMCLQVKNGDKTDELWFDEDELEEVAE